MLIIAVDLGRNVAAVYGADESALLIDSKELPQDLGAMMSDAEGWLRGLVRRVKPDMLFWERPFVTPNRHDAQGEIRTQRLYGQAALCARIAHDYSLRSDCAHPQTMRKAIVGAGNAKEDVIMRFCRSREFPASSPHEADAFVAWLYARRRCK